MPQISRLGTSLTGGSNHLVTSALSTVRRIKVFTPQYLTKLSSAANFNDFSRRNGIQQITGFCRQR
jgi:hypothetical protein